MPGKTFGRHHKMINTISTIKHFAASSAISGYVSVNGPHCDGVIWPHLGRFDVGVTEVFGPTCDTPGVVWQGVLAPSRSLRRDAVGTMDVGGRLGVESGTV